MLHDIFLLGYVRRLDWFEPDIGDNKTYEESNLSFPALLTNFLLRLVTGLFRRSTLAAAVAHALGGTRLRTQQRGRFHAVLFLLGFFLRKRYERFQ